MIPKIIHYCWFGKHPLPPLAQKCIKSWKEYLPDYEIKEWNEDNFNIHIIPYTSEAYNAKKFAFVSDYARFWILNKFGGIYFDTDVELIRTIDDILIKGGYMGFEKDADEESYGWVNPGLGMACEPNNNFLTNILQQYEKIHFKNEDGSYNIQKTIVHYTTELLKDYGLQKAKGIQYISNFYIYPSEYFAPIHFITKKLHITNNTRSIHQYMASWQFKNSNLKNKMRSFLPEYILILYNKIKYYKK